MSGEFSKACIKVAACICAKDGIISDTEERTIFNLIVERFPEIDEAMFENALNEFFDSDDQIEEYLSRISDEGLREFTLRLAEVSAAADGLDARENIALEKARMIWGLNQNA